MSLDVSDNNLPEGWTIAPLDEVSDINMGQSPPSSTYNMESEGLPFFQGKAEFGSFYPEAKKWCSVPSKVAQKEDILISVRAPVGPTNLAPTECCIGRGLAAIKPSGGMPNRYLLYYLRSIESDIDSLGTGSTFKAISGKVLRSIKVPIAPLEQQARIIAEIEKQFSRLDEAVANLKRVKANLKRYKAAVLKAAVEGKLTEEWRKLHPDVEPADKLLERILEERRANWQGRGKYKEPVAPDTSGLPELPEGWVIVSLEQITSAVRVICYGILMPKENLPNGVPYVKVKDMKGDKIDVKELHRTSPEIAAKYERASLKAGDLLLSIRGTYGRVAEVPSELEGGNITQDTARLDVLPPIDRNFMALQLRAPDIQEYFKRVARGVAVKGVNIGDIRPAPIFLPPLAEQQQIAAEVDRCLSIVEEAETEVDSNLRRADRLRQSILKQAFSSRLVPQDPNDEPANVLVERIRSISNVGAQHAAPRSKTEQPKRAKHASPLHKTPQSAEPIRAIHKLPLHAPSGTVELQSLDAVIASILDNMQPGHEYSRSDLADALGLSTNRWNAAIQELKRRGQVRQVGEKRGTKYLLR